MSKKSCYCITLEPGKAQLHLLNFVLFSKTLDWTEGVLPFPHLQTLGKTFTGDSNVYLRQSQSAKSNRSKQRHELFNVIMHNCAVCGLDQNVSTLWKKPPI